MLVDLVGALADPGVISEPAPPGTSRFTAVVKPILDDVLGRADDPDAMRAGTTRSGTTRSSACRSTAAGRRRPTTVPDAGWARELNLRTPGAWPPGSAPAPSGTTRRRSWRPPGTSSAASARPPTSSTAGGSSAEIGALLAGARRPRSRRATGWALAAPLLTFLTVDGAPARTVIVAQRRADRADRPGVAAAGAPGPRARPPAGATSSRAARRQRRPPAGRWPSGRRPAAGISRPRSSSASTRSGRPDLARRDGARRGRPGWPRVVGGARCPTSSA